MFVVTGGRASGKTSAIVRWLLENPAARGVLVKDAQRRDHLLRQLYIAMPRHDWRPCVISVTGLDLRGRMRGGRMFGFHELAIDDLQDVFAEMFGNSLEFATMNATWLPLGPEEPIKAEAETPNWSEKVIEMADEIRPKSTSKKNVSRSPLLAIQPNWSERAGGFDD